MAQPSNRPTYDLWIGGSKDYDVEVTLEYQGRTVKLDKQKFDPETGEVIEGQEAMFDSKVDPKDLFEGHRVHGNIIQIPSFQAFLQERREFDASVDVTLTLTVENVHLDRKKGLLVRVHKATVDLVHVHGQEIQAMNDGE